MELTVEKVRDLKPKIEFARDVAQAMITHGIAPSKAVNALEELLEQMEKFQDNHNRQVAQLFLNLVKEKDGA